MYVMGIYFISFVVKFRSLTGTPCQFRGVSYNKEHALPQKPGMRACVEGEIYLHLYTVYLRAICVDIYCHGLENIQ